MSRRVLLVSCYELGHQPLHVASAAAFLRQDGHDLRALDVAVEPFDEAAAQWADVVAIAVPMHTATRMAASLARRIRHARGDGVTIILYGLYAPLCHDVLPAGLVDHVVGGEFEAELARLVAGEQGGRTVVLDRLTFPVPSRDLLPPLDRYATLLMDGESRLAGYVEATRGCVHRCRHCPVPAVYDGRIRVIQRATMIEDVAQLHAAGSRHLTFGDPDFLNAVPHALAAVRAVHERFPDLTFDITTKVEHILEHAGVWAELRASGLLFVVSAVESTSQRVLDILDKGHTADDAVAALRLLREHGIDMRPSLLPFTPWSGLDDYLQLLDFVLDNNLVDSVDPVHLTIRLLVPHGSLLLARPEMTEHLTGYDPATFTHAWRHPDPAMDALQERLASMVAADADSEVDPRRTHHRIREMAAAEASAAGVSWGARLDAVPVDGPPSAVPRLSEPWFCCAEPTGGQLERLAG